MNYLLDTNAISEWVRPRPDPGIARWLDEVDEDRTYLSVITLGELRKGVDRLADGRRRDRLDRWLVHGLQVVTRSVAHFRHAGVVVICPWSG